MATDLSFSIIERCPQVAPVEGVSARAGVIETPHGSVQTPAFIPVGTKATVKTLTMDQVRTTGAQAVLSNGYHLYLQPGPDVVDAAGGLAAFERWDGPTFTDSGGFQVMSLGAGFGKLLAMDANVPEAEVIAAESKRNAQVDDDGVTFKSHIDGSYHRFTPEKAIAIQHALGSDVMMAFDELTALVNTRSYQEEALARTHAWAKRCLEEHNRQTQARANKPLQSLWGVVQGANHEDLRRKGASDLEALSQSFEADGLRGFGGYGIGGAFEKHLLGTIVGWATSSLPEDKPRHMLGISEPDDVFAAIDAGIDTFDCVNPSRMARRGFVYTLDGKINVKKAVGKHNHGPLDPTATHPYGSAYSRAYLHHLFKGNEILGYVILTVLNVAFTVRMVADARQAIIDGNYPEYRTEFLGRFYSADKR
ncbi:tRNA guanosine(34) transglycosylase Tgt [Stomatohabitans albus]|uniref:tRNA guanosine(34) transglycosylase Tgt n=1 Tax=Stomatohabitans albus TaxID=3110766 RepID=UPI00300DAA79